MARVAQHFAECEEGIYVPPRSFGAQQHPHMRYIEWPARVLEGAVGAIRAWAMRTP